MERRVPVSLQIIRESSEIVRESEEDRWSLWIVQDVALWRLVGPLSVDGARRHVPEIWAILLEQLNKWRRLFIILDGSQLELQSQELRDYVASEWSSVLDRDDIVVCGIDRNRPRKALRRAMLQLVGKLGRLQLFDDYESAFQFVSRQRTESEDTPGRRMRLEEIAAQLASQHDLFAEGHGQLGPENPPDRDAETRFQKAMENFPLAIYYYDLWGRFQWGNKAAEDVSGYNRAEVIGRPYYQTRLLTVEDLLKVSKLVAGSLTKTSTGPHEFTVVRKDGSLRFVDVWAHLTSFDKRKVLLCTAIDISERKLQELLKETDRSRERIGTVCMHCRKVKDKSGVWIPPEVYLYRNFRLSISHGLCPDCGRQRYPEHYSEAGGS